MTSKPDPAADGASTVVRRSTRPLDDSGELTPAYDLDRILQLLDHYHQRATYGAVAKLTHSNAAFMMNGRPRNPLHSWVVNQVTQLPTRYSEAETHPNLLARDRVLARPRDLAAWLRAPE